MQGPPGSGKTLLARALPGLLAPLTPAESIEVSKIYSVARLLSRDQLLLRERPVRAPHHTISHAGRPRIAARARGSVTFPARLLLVAAMNPWGFRKRLQQALARVVHLPTGRLVV